VPSVCAWRRLITVRLGTTLPQFGNALDDAALDLVREVLRRTT
jgi:hypothetical protein